MRRSPAAAAAILCLAAAAAPVPPAAAVPGGGLARTREFQQRVDRALERGVAALRKFQRGDGSFGDFGHSALATYTLAACAPDVRDPDVVRALRRLGEMRGDPSRNTYGVALALLALDAVHVGHGGQEKPPLEKWEREWAESLAAWLVRAQGEGGGFQYVSPNTGGWDNSNSQYALLGLKAASRLGVSVPRAVWERALAHFLRNQERTGPEVPRVVVTGVDEKGYGTGRKTVGRDHARGWAYGIATDAGTGSMTSGGVSSVAICRSELAGTMGWSSDDDARAVRSIRDGLAWLGRHFTVEGNPWPSHRDRVLPAWHYYYLYGLERAGVLAGVAWMGEHDWYGEGATYLCREQEADGTWNGSGGARPARAGRGGRAGDLLDTCFALLFLKKATFRDGRGAVATEEDDADLDLTGAADLDDATFGAVFAAVLGRYARAGAEKRADLAADFLRMGPRALGLLILRLDEEAVEARAVAADALERVTGETRGFRADAPDADRAAAVAAWEEWYAPRRARLVADLEAGRFVEP